MHEAGIADRILDIVVARATEAVALRVTTLHLVEADQPTDRRLHSIDVEREAGHAATQ